MPCPSRPKSTLTMYHPVSHFCALERCGDTSGKNQTGRITFSAALLALKLVVLLLRSKANYSKGKRTGVTNI